VTGSKSYTTRKTYIAFRSMCTDLTTQPFLLYLYPEFLYYGS
jgi:hypothetical protein